MTSSFFQRERRQKSANACLGINSHEVIKNDRQVVSLIQNLVWRPQAILLVKLPRWGLLAIAAAVGAIWAACLLNWSFITGQDRFWQFPKGTIGGSDFDMAQVLIGYLYYVQSPWQLPLFYVSNLGAPAGTNVVFTDVVPIIAVLGKLVYSLTGTIINLYGLYLFLCFALPGVMMTLVLIAARIPYALAAVIAAIFADTTPALLWRWGHIALSAHFLLVGALALYLLSFERRSWHAFGTVWIAYLCLAYLTDIYLFVMVGVVWLCVVIQRQLNGLTTARQTLGTAMLTIALVSIVIALGGQFGFGTLPFTPDYGRYSMNLASPFLPQSSGIFPWLGGVVDATGGQFEGFNYLGLGLLLASLLILPAEVSWLRRNLNQHIALFMAFVALAAFAVSHRVFVSHWLVFELPLPQYIGRILGIFRSSGRFFWLLGYAQMAVVIVLGFRRSQPAIAVCLAAAAVIQLLDVQPLRAQIIASIAAGPNAPELDAGQVRDLLAEAHQIEVVPSVQCSYSATKDQVATNIELMLAAARANVPINTVYLSLQSYSYGLSLLEVLRAPSRAVEMWHAKRDDYCNHEIERARIGGPGNIIVLLSAQARTNRLGSGVDCRPLSWARVCKKSDPLQDGIR